MASLTADFPVREDLVAGSGRTPWLIAERWRVWLRNLVLLVQAVPHLIADAVELTSQGASIGTTAIPTDALAPGLYRVTWYARVTTAAGVSSSLTVMISWTSGAVACSFSGAAMTGNTTATSQSQSQLIEIDQSSPVSYATTYASNAAGAMRYQLSIVLEAVNV